MVSTLKEIHEDGTPVRRGKLTARVEKDAKPGEYTKMGNFTVVPRTDDSGRFTGGAVFPKVKQRYVDDKMNITYQRDVDASLTVDQQRAITQPHFPGMFQPDGPPPPPPVAVDPNVKAQQIAALEAQNRNLEEQLRILEQDTGGEQPAPIPATPYAQKVLAPVPVQQPRYSPPPVYQQPQPDMTAVVGGMLDAINNLRAEMAQLRYSAQPQQASVPEPEVPGAIRVSFTGDFGTVRSHYDTVQSYGDFLILGRALDREYSYDPPVSQDKPITLAVEGIKEPIEVVNPGLSFDYKGDKLLIVLINKV